MAQALWTRLRGVLHSRPVLSNAVATSGLMAAGDVLAQFFIEDQPYSWKRTAKLAAIGGIVVAPAIVKWYNIMETRLGPGKPLVKVVLDQVLFAPCMLTVIMPMVDLLSGYDTDYAWKHWKADFADVIVTNWTIWPAVQAVNFTFVPPNYRVLVVQTVAVGWNTYLAWKMHQPKSK